METAVKGLNAHQESTHICALYNSVFCVYKLHLFNGQAFNVALYVCYVQIQTSYLFMCLLTYCSN